MEEIKKIGGGVECSKDDCGKKAVTKIKTSSEGLPLHLCSEHEEEFAEKLREEMMDKYEGMSEEEIAQKIVAEGESIL